MCERHEQKSVLAPNFDAANFGAVCIFGKWQYRLWWFEYVTGGAKYFA